MAEPIRPLPTESNAPESRGARDGAHGELVKPPKAAPPITLEEARQSMKRISRDHREIIKALAK